MINIFIVLDEKETFQHHDRTTAASTTWCDGGVIGWTSVYWSVHLQVLHWLIVVDSMCFCTKRHETHRFIIMTQLLQTDGFIKPVTEIQTKSISTITDNMINTAVLTQVSVSPVLSSHPVFRCCTVLHYSDSFGYFMFTLITHSVINTFILIIGEHQTDQLSSLWISSMSLSIHQRLPQSNRLQLQSEQWVLSLLCEYFCTSTKEQTY